jgi:hypothetical protein
MDGLSIVIRQGDLLKVIAFTPPFYIGDTMNIKELKKILSNYPDDFEVVMSSDEEGNSFSPLADFGVGFYVPETTWSGEVFMGEDMEEEGLSENCIVLWPTN